MTGRAHWCRLWPNGPGLWIGNTPKLFSERHGYTRALPLPFGWRLRYLPPWKY